MEVRKNPFLAISLILFALICFQAVELVFAATPNPGHPWTETGDGTFAVSGPTALRTFTFPDANATVLTSNAAVTLAQGGTGASLTASNGGIIYSNASTMAVLGGTATAGQILRSGSSAAPSWSTATYPATAGSAGKVLISDGTNFVASTPTYPNSSATAGKILRSDGTNFAASTATFPDTAGTSGNVLTSDGTNWTSSAPAGAASITTVVTEQPYLTTGAVAAVANNSLTTRKVALFYVPGNITVNQLTYNVGAATTAGSYRICVYNEAGTTKHIDVTDVPTAGVNSVTVSPGVALTPGFYYIAMGCATTCNNTITMFTSTAATWINTNAVPAGKKVYEGTVSHTSGTCNSTLGTVTGVISHAPVMRLDN